MTWKPIVLGELESKILRELLDCSVPERQLFARVRIPPTKWKLPNWGDEGGGFWAVAVYLDRVLWFNDIEDGFNVSTFELPGEIPAGEYACNQDELRHAVPKLVSGRGQRLGPPQPIESG